MSIPPNMRLIVDADHLIFRVGLDERVPLRDQVQKLGEEINHLFTWTMASSVKLVISDSSSNGFRKNMISSGYKENRKNARRPKFEAELRDHLLQRGALMIPTLEADDTCCIEHIKLARELGEDSVATYGVDKDLLTYPGHHFCLVYQKDSLYPWQPAYKFVSKLDALYNHMWQVIVGDPADGIKGARRKGVKAAELTLNDPSFEHDYWAAVCGVYAETGQGLEEAILNAQLTFLLRPENYNNGEISLWSPDQFYKMLDEAKNEQK